jgi:hypothetical protein
MDDGNKNPLVYGTAPKSGMGAKMQSGKAGIGSNNPKPYGPKPSFGTGASNVYGGGRTFASGTKKAK